MTEECSMSGEDGRISFLAVISVARCRIIAPETQNSIHIMKEIITQDTTEITTVMRPSSSRLWNACRVIQEGSGEVCFVACVDNVRCDEWWPSDADAVIRAVKGWSNFSCELLLQSLLWYAKSHESYEAVTASAAECLLEHITQYISAGWYQTLVIPNDTDCFVCSAFFLVPVVISCRWKCEFFRVTLSIYLSYSNKNI